MDILRVCKYCGYSIDEPTAAMFDSLIMSIFLYGVEVWGSPYHSKYMHIGRIDKFCRRAMKSGYTSKFTPFADTIRYRGMKLWEKISTDKKHCLYYLLPKQRNRMLRDRGHNFILPAWS